MRTEAGFTLLELVVALSILGVVGLVITQAMFVALKTSDKTDQRIRETGDAQLITDWFGTDIQSAVSLASAGTDCGANTILRLAWSDNGDSNIVAYASESAPGNVRQLVRRHCTTDGITTTLDDEQTLARSLANALPTVRCQPTACGSTPMSPTSAETVTLSIVTETGSPYDISATTRAVS